MEVTHFKLAISIPLAKAGLLNELTQIGADQVTIIDTIGAECMGLVVFLMDLEDEVISAIHRSPARLLPECRLESYREFQYFRTGRASFTDLPCVYYEGG
ncbi:MAG: hypothetical protein A3I07_02060 [Candidatus Doudnabacteria bacterium RIFCSPLOWO2_02_FULL_42_9]|uniref:Uncharacterized protein n=1 Tax=Candidatus Doudnabacteria bacterium RIFCSPHIGHO2_01_FULL_41_86 TaxID=1817821 RepID=A0A1F5N850_9BACT|nr:MAG: hypothetical protein A2717_03710 [Candidatus Doudnabacteria bacterium RIFCSPHIGHO2_01_FULL_41_86]OGE74780.1 MAG: hypothetical protein A3K07_03300 [Candidatus Doudnabacteria bacterium RIFCSPHIGHO2_01_43_10]OGE85748.1 MAG: hypothetical protein A3E28_03040 [Candidatus Doudnabacteria bacterium RIFCSPHIGHO2_12_FULL_42_22]OGE87243.1 MAG: hypothetical protein A3C49_00665 [Candidatus Doudnabacteria bacterium RIFCSPHIGHO2_02_FULL_42_25]OGE92080.1 MAG: hypothetical protein A2895_00540 [Candidatus